MFKKHLIRHVCIASSRLRLALAVAVLAAGLMVMAPVATAAGSGFTSHVVSCTSGKTTSYASFKAPNPGGGWYQFRWAFFNGSTRIYLSNFVSASIHAGTSAMKSFTLTHSGQRVTRVLAIVKSDAYGSQWNSWKDC